MIRNPDLWHALPDYPGYPFERKRETDQQGRHRWRVRRTGSDADAFCGNWRTVAKAEEERDNAIRALIEIENRKGGQ